MVVCKSTPLYPDENRLIECQSNLCNQLLFQPPPKATGRGQHISILLHSLSRSSKRSAWAGL
jgi:hypothetical protein